MRIGAVQCRAVYDDAATTCRLIAQRARWAEREKIDLLLFPEAFLLGHAYDPSIIQARAKRASASAVAELCRSVAGSPVTLVVGAFEQTSPHVFNHALVIRNGRIEGRYAKAHPNEPSIAAGTEFPTFVDASIRYGINICNDANHSTAAERVARQGATLILCPLNNMLPPVTAERWRTRSLANLVARAQETGCWVASSDVTGEADGQVSYGCTAIVAPDGKVVTRVPEMVESVAVHNIPTGPYPARR